MKVIGWIGFLHIGVIILWMGINIVFSLINPHIIEEGERVADSGIAYYSNYPGYLGFDHGSKALIMLLSIALPIGLYVYFKKRRDFQLLNIIALIAGCMGFLVYSISLMLQAVTVEYAFQLYRSSEDSVSHNFAALLYDWAMLEGGLSVSLYIIANLLLACWVLMHSHGLNKTFKGLSRFGWIVGSLQILGNVVAWFFLMQGNQNMHEWNEAIGLLFLVWIFILSLKWVRRKFIL